MNLRPIKFLGIVVRITVNYQTDYGMNMNRANHIRELMEGIAFRHGFTMEAIRGPSRRQELVFARWEIIQELTKPGMNLTRTKIGELINRDSSTISNSIKRINEASEIRGILNYRKHGTVFS